MLNEIPFTQNSGHPPLLFSLLEPIQNLFPIFRATERGRLCDKLEAAIS